MSRTRHHRRAGAAACGFALLVLCTVLAGRSRPAAAGEARPLDKFFHGKVVALDGQTVTLRYDFRKKDQVKDWLDRIPYRIQPRKDQGIRWFDEKLEVVGNAGARHMAEWMGEVSVSATFVPHLEKDFGGFLSPITETEDFATFTFVETHFHRFDNSAGGTNSIIKFGAEWREGDSGEEFIGFRYVSRKPPKNEPEVGKPIRASFGLHRKKLFFTLPEYEMKGSDKGKKKLKRFFVGFYAISGRMLLDNIEITGKLASDWLKRENVELRTEKPIGELEEGVDAETRTLLEQHAAGEFKATRRLLDILKDESRGPEVHQAVVGGLSTGPKKAVRSVIDLLYHPREPVREFGIEIVRTQLGKDYGYKAKGSEKSRRTALQKLNKDISDNPGLLRD
jgi:hypothetical protein